MDDSINQPLFSHSGVAFAILSRVAENDAVDYQFETVNGPFETLLGLSEAVVRGQLFSSFLLLKENASLFWTPGESEAQIEITNKAAARSGLDGEQRLRVSFFELGDKRFGASFLDITKEYSLQREILGIQRVSNDMLAELDGQWRFVSVNSEFTRVLGYSRDDVSGVRFVTLLNIDDVPGAFEMIRKADAELVPMEFTCLFHCKNGAFSPLDWRFCRVGGHVFASCGMPDASGPLMQRKRDPHLLTVRNDDVTGLYNREFFFRSAPAEMDRADLYGEKITLLLIEFEHLKTLNDTWGHPVNDDLMKKAAQVVGHTIRKSDLAAHFGGDEIAILLPQTALPGAMAAADKLRKAIAENVRTKPGRIGASFGIAERLPDESLEAWYRRADAALHDARKRGRSSIAAADATILERDLEEYIWKKEFDSGNTDIDIQHRALMFTGRQLTDLARSGASFSEIMPVVEQLMAEVSDHFAYEEDVLFQAKYPEYKQHCKIHQKLLGKLAFLRDSYQRQQIKSPVYFRFMTEELVLTHLLTDDMRFFPYLKADKPTKSHG